jgi:hypothetical protein
MTVRERLLHVVLNLIYWRIDKQVGDKIRGKNMKKHKRFMFRPSTKYIFAVITILLFIVSILSYGLFIASISMGAGTYNDHNVTINSTISFDREYLDTYTRNEAIHLKIEYSWRSNLSMKVIVLDETNYIHYTNNAPYSSIIEKTGANGTLIMEYSRPNIPTGKYHVRAFVDPQVRHNLSNDTKVKFYYQMFYEYEKVDGIYLWAYDGGLSPLFLYAANMNAEQSMPLCITPILSLTFFVLLIPVTYLSIVRSKKGKRRKSPTRSSEEE